MAVKAHAEDVLSSVLGYWLVMVVLIFTAPVPLLPAASIFSVAAVPGATRLPFCKIAFHAEDGADAAPLPAASLSFKI